MRKMGVTIMASEAGERALMVRRPPPSPLSPYPPPSALEARIDVVTSSGASHSLRDLALLASLFNELRSSKRKSSPAPAVNKFVRQAFLNSCFNRHHRHKSLSCPTKRSRRLRPPPLPEPLLPGLPPRLPRGHPPALATAASVSLPCDTVVPLPAASCNALKTHGNSDAQSQGACLVVAAHNARLRWRAWHVTPAPVHAPCRLPPSASALLRAAAYVRARAHALVPAVHIPAVGARDDPS